MLHVVLSFPFYWQVIFNLSMVVVKKFKVDYNETENNFPQVV